MLSELRIQNFAIIDKLDLRPGAGLIILTGETGAGKSIILDAVVMLIGGRADTTFLRTDADTAFVEAVFHLTGSEREAVHFILNREELMDDPNHVTLMREVRKEGRSVARVNGRTVNVGLLKELGALLGPRLADYPLLPQAIAFALVFVLAIVAGALIAWPLRAVVHGAGLGFLDRGLDAVFGVARAALLALVFAVVAGLSALPQRDWWQNSYFAPELEAAALAVRPWLPRAWAERLAFPQRRSGVANKA